MNTDRALMPSNLALTRSKAPEEIKQPPLGNFLRKRIEPGFDFENNGADEDAENSLWDTAPAPLAAGQIFCRHGSFGVPSNSSFEVETEAVFGFQWCERGRRCCNLWLGRQLSTETTKTCLP
jgi:hypothetical protein